MAQPTAAAGAPQPPPFDPSKPYQTMDSTTAKPAAPAFDPSKPSQSYDPKNLPPEKVPGTPTYPTRSSAFQPKERPMGALAAEQMGYDPDVNYMSGSVPFLAQATLKTADNPDEAKAIMEHFFGKGNYGQDKGGRWWAKIGGKKFSVFSPIPGGELAAGIVGTAPVTAGSIGGGLTGAEFGPGGAVVGAGAGAALGKAVDEARKAALGEFKKTVGQEAATLAQTAVENAAFEAGGQLVGHGLSMIGPAIRGVISKPTAEGSAMTGTMLARGARPPLASAAPGAKVFHYDQQLRNLIRGNPQEARNVLYIQNQMRDMLRREGMSESEINGMVDEINESTGAAISSRKEGEGAVNVVVRHHEMLADAAEKAVNTAKSELGRTDKLLTTLSKQAPGDLGLNVAAELQASRRSFGVMMNSVYDHIDRVVGGASVIPTFLLKKTIKPIVDALPPEKLPGIFREINELPGSVSIKQMQRYRTRLRELADGGLTPDIDNHLMADAARAADASFDKAFFANPPDTRPMLNILKQVFGELPSEKAVRLLRDADAMYAQGIAKYKDGMIRQLVNQAKSGIPVDANVIAEQVVQVGQSERAKTILSLLTPETRRQVAAADMKNILRDAAKETGGDGSKVMSGDSLLNVLNQRGALLDTVYGPVYGQKFVGTITEQAKRLAALDGKVDISALQPGKETLAIEDAIQKTQAIDDFVKGNPVAALRDGKPQDVDRAMRYLIQPGNEAKLEAAVNFYGPQSQVVKDMRRYALKSILAKAQVEMPSRTRTIGGTAIDDALKRFTPKQQELLFPDGLLEDMRTIAKEAKFLFPFAGEDMGASLAAAQIKGHVPFRLTADMNYLYRAFMGWIADRPTTIRLLSTGFAGPDMSKTFTRQALKMMVRSFFNSQVSGPGRGIPSAQ